MQNYLTQKVTEFTSSQLNTKVSIGNVNIKFFRRLVIDDLYIEDQNQDTLLYANQVFVRIGVLNLLRRKIELKRVELKNPKLYLHRLENEEKYNFDFILEKSFPLRPDKSTEPLDFSLHTLIIENLDFNLLDELKKKQFKITFDEMEATAKLIDPVEKEIHLEKLKLTGAYILVNKFFDPLDSLKEKKPSRPKSINNADLHLLVDQVDIQESIFQNINENKPKVEEGMDYNNLLVRKINIQMENAEFLCDTIFGKVNHLSAKEKSGFQIINLSADARVSTTQVECRNLNLKTPHSNISNYFSMDYNSFADFKSFIHDVYMSGNFKNSKLALRDINYFAKGALTKIAHNTLNLTGDIYGTVENLKGKELKINLGNHSYFSGGLSFKGLPKFNETFINLDIQKVVTSSKDLQLLYPYMKYPDNLTTLGRVIFSGEFVGFPNDFVANGLMKTAIGSVSSDINMKLGEKNELAQYSGHFSATNFDLGKWFEQEDLMGKISLTTEIKGAGIELKNLEAYLDGFVQTLTLKQYVYKDIVIDGNVKDRFFEGQLAIKDENLDMDFEGEIDLNDSVPVFKFISHLREANLKALNITEDYYKVSSTLHLDFEGKNLDNFKGYAGLFNTAITKKDETFNLDIFELEAYPQGSGKTIELRSDIADATMKGNINYQDLPKALTDLFNHYFKQSNGKQQISFKDQNFNIEAKIRDTKNLTRLIHPQFAGIKGAELLGIFDSKSHFIGLNAEVERISYGKYTVKDVAVNSISDSKSVFLSTTIDSFFINDSLLVEHIAMENELKKDSVLFKVSAQSDSCPNRMRLNGMLKTNLKNFRVNILPSSIFVGNNEWEITKNNTIYYEPGKLEIDNLILSKEESELELKAFNDPLGNTHLSLFLRELDLNEITSPFAALSKTKMEGEINGSVTVLNILQKPTVVASVKIDTFFLNNEKWGNVNLNSNYIPEKEIVEIKGTVKGADNDIQLDGIYNLASTNNYLDFNCKINSLYLSRFEPFIRKEVSKVAGYINGNLQVKGNIQEPIITGNLYGHDVQAKVNYLNTIYSFDDEEIILRKGEIDVGDLVIYDEYGNTANGRGKITYSTLQDLYLDFSIQTDNFLFLNTTHASSEYYYGRVFAGGLALITGPPKEVQFLIAAKTNKNTTFSIDVASTQDVDKYTFYRFIDDKENKKVNQAYKTKIKGLKLDMDLEITPDAEVNLILDYDEGDVIKAEGEGNIKVNIDPYGELSIIGNYEIDDGSYVFSMQNVINKRFNMNRGSSILWTGDPAGAKLDISAVYRLRASPYDLVSDIVTGDDALQTAKNRVQVYLYLYITGPILEPEINFDIKIPDSDPTIRTELDSRLQLIKSDPFELNKQVVGLLVLNRFLPVISGSAEPTLASDLSSTVSEFISNQLSVYLSDWISEFITEVQLDINYRTYTSEISNVDNQVDFENRQELQLALTKSFYNDRISVDIGGNFDFGESGQNANTSGSNNVAGDFEIEYSITPDGRIKVKAFRKGEYDIFQNRNKNKQGVGISWQKEFDTMKDFFQGIRKRKEQRNEKISQDSKENSSTN